MHDVRPVIHLIGWLSLVLGGSMLMPIMLELRDGSGNALGFSFAGFLTLTAGLAMVAVTRERAGSGLTRHQAFLLTVLVWVILPGFGALPFVFGAPEANYTDAFFEAMSAMTTTGSTVFTGLDEAPRGMLLWRALMQWYGGLGIVIVAIVFLPEMRIGGMQFFRSEAFDLSGDIIPRATEIAGELFYLYVGLTGACALAYSAAGMTGFDALCHAMTTLSTGGFGNHDNGFEDFSPQAHCVGAIFMMLAAMPFVRMVQMMRGESWGLYRDSQARGFIAIIAVVSTILIAWVVLHGHHPLGQATYEVLFNVTSVLTGTGYASEAYDQWGALPVAMFFVIPLIGGCSASTSCSAKVFRYQILTSALIVQIRRVHTPHGIFPLHYQGRPVAAEIVSSVMAFFFVFVCCLAIWAILLSLMGLDTITSVSGSVAALTNLGPGLGPVIGPSGSFASLPDAAKWLLAFGMILGRLEFLSVLVLFLPVFWQR